MSPFHRKNSAVFFPWKDNKQGAKKFLLLIGGAPGEKERQFSAWPSNRRSHRSLAVHHRDGLVSCASGAHSNKTCMGEPSVFYMNGEVDSPMTPGQLVKAVSIALNVSEETVVQHDRNLVVAGLRTKGGRGSSAPSVTPRDAARLVAGVLGSVKVKDTVSVVQALENTKVMTGGEGYKPLPLPRFGELKSDHSFIDALTAIIEDADTPQMFEDFPEFARRFSIFWVTVSGRWPSIFFMPTDALSERPSYKNSLHISYEPTPRLKTTSGSSRDYFWDWRYYTGVEQERKIRGNCFMILGLCFQKEIPASVEAAFRKWRSAAKKAA
jgi:hypothetical protein